jgi:serine/threonine protein kinase
LEDPESPLSKPSVGDQIPKDDSAFQVLKRFSSLIKMGRQRKALEEADRALEEADSTMLMTQLAAIEAYKEVEEYQELTRIFISEKENAVRERDEAMERQGRFTRYFIEDVMAATHSLSYEARIGEGRYGRVYKGQFHVTSVAIRVLDYNCFMGGFQFQREMDRLSSIKHPRLVMLMGACPDGGFIVYDHMPRGSLEDRLLCKDGTPPLPWFDRLRIAAEVCEGLLFLHTLQPDPIVHHHVKPSNILLDNDLGSKISDFGLLQLLSDPSRVHDSTTDSNVYSFGILVLQLLTGKPANEPEVGFIDRVKAALARDDALKHLLDEGGKWPPELARQLATIALDCTVERSLPRAMESLEKILVDFPKPQPRHPECFCCLINFPNSPPQPPDYFCCPISMVSKATRSIHPSVLLTAFDLPCRC